MKPFLILVKPLPDKLATPSKKSPAMHLHTLIQSLHPPEASAMREETPNNQLSILVALRNISPVCAAC